MKLSKDYKDLPVQQTASLFRGRGIPDSHAVVFTANTLRFLLSTALSATGSERLEVGPERTVTPKEHTTSGSNQMTTPRQEASHGMPGGG